MKNKSAVHLKRWERDHLIEWLYIITNQPRELWNQMNDQSLVNAYEKNVSEHGKEVV